MVGDEALIVDGDCERRIFDLQDFVCGDEAGAFTHGHDIYRAGNTGRHIAVPPVAGGADGGFGETLIKKIGFGFGGQVIDEGFEVGVFDGALLAW